MDRHSLHILLVDDNEADAKLTELALRQKNPDCLLTAIASGEEALAYLGGAGRNNHAAMPDIMMIDLHLAGMSGMELLRAIRLDKNLERIPVIIFSSSSYEKDIEDSYLFHANTFVYKPMEFDSLMEVMNMIVKYWGTIASLPLKHENIRKIAV